MWYLFLQAYCQKHSLKKSFIRRRKERRKRQGSAGRNRGGRKECKLIWGQRKQGFSLNPPASFPATLSLSSNCLSPPHCMAPSWAVLFPFSNVLLSYRTLRKRPKASDLSASVLEVTLVYFSCCGVGYISKYPMGLLEACSLAREER